MEMRLKKYDNKSFGFTMESHVGIIIDTKTVIVNDGENKDGWRIYSIKKRRKSEVVITHGFGYSIYLSYKYALYSSTSLTTDGIE
ncbi:hypothetical protein BpHYR1_010533 [Brachionus plicatilis]|uniref:Uncharacterized protein n=1 Tax=Brachionus plicatilis TaxID=10195 RepID=A0A3M7PZ26_BRAPC|nr:hypothetical protein BpHYR1_010533 [Brachionus plicatilis]